MIGHIITWSLRNKLFVVTATLLLLAWGGWQATRTPIDVFPDLTAPAVTVVAEAHGMAPTDVESLITLPIETALNGAPGVRRAGCLRHPLASPASAPRIRFITFSGRIA